MNSPIFNRDGAKAPDGDWYQIEAKGEHPNRAEGVLQVIDDQAIKSIVDNFNKDAKAGTLSHGHEILVDRDHLKDQMDQETRAYGWLQELQARPDGIWGRIKWTGTGKAAVEGGDYKYFSTEYAPKDLQKVSTSNSNLPRVRPLKLDGLTLTNMPNNKGQEGITNRAAGASPVNLQPCVRKFPSPHWEMDQRTAAQMFSEVVRLVRNRIGGTFDEAYRKVMVCNRDLFEPGYDRNRCASGFGRMLNRVEKKTGLSSMAAIDRSADEISAMTLRFSPLFNSAPTAFQWDILNRAAEVLGRAGIPGKIFNRATPGKPSAADMAAANSNADDVLDYLKQKTEILPKDIGAQLQGRNAEARQIWLTFYAQVKTLMAENNISTVQAFNQLKDEQPLFWTMAMLSFDDGATA